MSRYPRRRNHRFGPRVDRRTGRRRHGERRDHGAQNGRYARLPTVGHRDGGHDLRDRRAGFEIHPAGSRRRGGFHHERGLRRRHRLFSGGAGGETRHRDQGRIRRVGAGFEASGAAGRTLHRVHGSRPDGRVARWGAGRRSVRGTGVFGGDELSESGGARAQDWQRDLLPGRYGLQRRGGRGFRADPEKADHRAARTTA